MKILIRDGFKDKLRCYSFSKRFILIAFLVVTFVVSLPWVVWQYFRHSSSDELEQKPIVGWDFGSLWR